MMQFIVRVMVLGLMLAVGGSAVTASTASISAPGSSAGTFNAPITADDLKPSQCSGITLTAVVSGSGVITGGAASELITGSASADTMDGGLGDDCILAGGGDDSLTGGDGTDVCDGGGDAGDTFATCETEIP